MPQFLSKLSPGQIAAERFIVVWCRRWRPTMGELVALNDLARRTFGREGPPSRPPDFKELERRLTELREQAKVRRSA